MKAENYTRYYRQPKEDKRGAVAKFIDFYGGLLVLGLITAFVILRLVGSPLLAVFPIMAAVGLEVWLAVFLRRRREARRIMHKRLWLAGRECMSAILKVQHGRKFNEFIRNVLAKQPGFEKMHVSKAVDEDESGGSGIDVRGFYMGQPVAVRCIRLEETDKKLGREAVKEFVGSMAVENIKNGILVTTGRFSRQTYEMVEELKGKYELVLINGIGLIELARRAGIDAFPSEEVVDRLLREEREKLNTGGKLTIKSFYNDRRKAGLYFSAAFLLGLVVIMQPWTFLSIVYLSFAALNVALGILGIIFDRAKEDAEPLAGFKPKTEG